MFTGFKVTTQGQALLAKAQTGSALVMTRVQIGSGYMPDGSSMESMTALVTPIKYITISGLTTSGNKSTVKFQITNISIAEGFEFREVGLFAKEGSTGSEILYAYGNCGDDADIVPPPNISTVDYVMALSTVTGNATNVTAERDASLVFATQASVKAAIDEITPARIGAATDTHEHPVGGITGLNDALTAKANRVGSATAGNIATLDENGDILDSGLPSNGTFAASAHNHLCADIISAAENVDGEFFRGSTAPTGVTALAYSGYFTATRVYGSYYSDYAEYFNVQGETEPGDVIMIDIESPGTFKRCDIEASPLAVGVVSGDYFICIGRANGSGNVPVALAGKLRAKVHGKCNPGDMLTSSGINGSLRAGSKGEVLQPGAILGQALAAKPDPAPALLPMLILRR